MSPASSANLLIPTPTLQEKAESLYRIPGEQRLLLFCATSYLLPYRSKNVKKKTLRMI